MAPACGNAVVATCSPLSYCVCVCARVCACVCAQAIEKSSPVDGKKELAEVYSRRASLFSVLGRHVEALQDARCCLRLDPNYSAGYFRMGVSFFALSMFQEAADTFMLVRARGLGCCTYRLRRRGLGVCPMFSSPTRACPVGFLLPRFQGLRVVPGNAHFKRGLEVAHAELRKMVY